MDAELRRYLNGLFALLGVAVGASLTALVLPTTGEAVNTGSVLLWTAVFAALVGGAVYLAVRPERVDDPVVEPAREPGR